jgi:D-alanine transaminase
MTRIAYVNGNFVPEAAATVSIFDRGFLFADGVYEVIVLVDGQFVDDAPHLERLERSLREIQMAPPIPRDAMSRMLRSLVEQNGVTEGMVYLQVTRGVAERDFTFPPVEHPSLVAWTRAIPVLDHPRVAQGVAAVTVPDQRWARRDIKSIALLPQVLAKQAARAAGAFEALMVEDGYLTEGGSATLFMVKGDTLVTHPLGTTVLPGITRERVIRLASQRGMSIVERTIRSDELISADELFITAATVLVMPVVSVNGAVVGAGVPGRVTLSLRADYIASVRHGAAAM